MSDGHSVAAKIEGHAANVISDAAYKYAATSH